MDIIIYINEKIVKSIKKTLNEDVNYNTSLYHHSKNIKQALIGFNFLCEREKVEESILDNLEKNILNAGESYLIPLPSL